MVSTCAPNRDCEIVTQATQVHAERSGSISSFLCSEPRFFTRCMPVDCVGPHRWVHTQQVITTTVSESALLVMKDTRRRV
jgi:hypothetical protein